MKALSPFFVFACLATAAPSSQGAIILSQDFDLDDPNYVLPPGSEFVQDATDPTKYWNLSNAVGASLNPSILGNATTYLTGQNMDAPLVFTTGTPAQVDFVVNVTNITDLELSIDLAGLLSPEPENYVRAFLDGEGDGFFETQIFNFAGTGNLPYTDPILGQLSETFATFSGLALPSPTAPDGLLRLRLEIYNDTNSLNEAVGVDNILITGTVIPEPGAALLAGIGCVGFARRRRR
ncbi:MAG: PEP-CTERM sorting domain-containing protein [Verrucomicrobiales bacterium]